MLLDTKMSPLLLQGRPVWAPRCSFSKHFLSVYYVPSSVLGVGQIVVSKKDVTPSRGAYSLPFPPSPIFPKKRNFSQFPF